MPSLLRLPRSAWIFATEVIRGVCFRLFEHLAPVRRKRWAFATWPGRYAHTLDNPRAVFEEVKDDPSIQKIILRRREQDPETVVAEGVNVHFVQVESVRGAWLLATSEVLFTGYSLGSLCSYSRWLSTKHKIIQLWHGVPLKRIGKLFAGETHWDTETPKYYATICSSTRDREIMSAAFAPLPLERTWLTGLPRNDLLLKPEQQLPADYRRELEKVRKKLQGRRLVLYAPTWRAESAGTYQFGADELAQLEAVMQQHNAVFGIRAHANRRPSAGETSSSRVIFLNDHPDVSVVLREAEILITDYSSIFIDFMVADRPCLFFTYDLESYTNERGFLYDFESAIAGQKSEAFSELIVNISNSLEEKLVLDERYWSSKLLFHEHDSGPTKQVVKAVMAAIES